jgi:hypothetical protein
MAIVSIPTSIGGVSLPGQLGNIASGPLSTLFGGPGVSTFNYPRDLATNATKSHYVKFGIKEIIPAGFQVTNGSIDHTSGTQIDFSGITEAGVTVLNKSGFGGLADKIKTTVGDKIQPKLDISPKTTKSVGIISLYMPDTLNASYNSNYTEMSLTSDVGNLQTIRQLNQVAGKLASADFGQGILKTLGNIASTDPATIDLVTKIASEKLGLGQTGSLLLKGQGFAINPQMQMIYQSISLRTFNLSFVFTPKTSMDSETIDKIIWMFKNHSLPSLQTAGQTSTDSMYLVPPSIFNVDFLINASNNKYLPKYGDCVLENVEVNFAPNGWAAFDSGAPVQTTLQLSFREIQALDRSKIGTRDNHSGPGVLR